MYEIYCMTCSEVVSTKIFMGGSICRTCPDCFEKGMKNIETWIKKIETDAIEKYKKSNELDPLLEESPLGCYYMP